jgi:mono/diheme cytochrome c family protein
MERAAKNRLAWAVGGTAIGIALATAIIIWRPWQSELSADVTNTGLVAEGRAVYAARCASCHGKELEGQANWRERMPNGRLPAPPHDASGHTWHHSDRQLFEITRNGIAGVVPGYESDMLAFKDDLSDRQIWAVLAFIKSSWPEDTHERQQRLNRKAE